MGTRLEGRVAVVTGSTSGIGRASAELFAEEGAKVVINGRRQNLGEEVVAGIQAKDGEATYFYADIGKHDEIRSLIKHAVDTYGRLDILMNNAYSGKSLSITEMDDAGWDAIFATTVKAVSFAGKYAIPEMVKTGGGSIINVSSVHGLGSSRHNAGYNAAKAALINLTRQMALEFGIQGVRVNAMCPARIVTEKKQRFLEAHPEQVRLQKLVYPLGRPGTMREAATAALFLASDESSFVTGHTLVVDGGLMAQLPDEAVKYVDSADA
jgi:NAD(P)-dependent dehydrogenase (short-subunit alcohol dehydrogenase family)